MIRSGIDEALAVTRAWFERHGTDVGPGHWFGQPAWHFRLGYGWPTMEQLGAGLENLVAAAEAARG
jgi:hypothetical protein